MDKISFKTDYWNLKKELFFNLICICSMCVIMTNKNFNTFSCTVGMLLNMKSLFQMNR